MTPRVRDLDAGDWGEKRLVICGVACFQQNKVVVHPSTLKYILSSSSNKADKKKKEGTKKGVCNVFKLDSKGNTKKTEGCCENPLLRRKRSIAAKSVAKGCPEDVSVVVYQLAWDNRFPIERGTTEHIKLLAYEVVVRTKRNTLGLDNSRVGGCGRTPKENGDWLNNGRRMRTQGNKRQIASRNATHDGHQRKGGHLIWLRADASGKIREEWRSGSGGSCSHSDGSGSGYIAARRTSLTTVDFRRYDRGSGGDAPSCIFSYGGVGSLEGVSSSGVRGVSCMVLWRGRSAGGGARAARDPVKKVLVSVDMRNGTEEELQQEATTTRKNHPPTSAPEGSDEEEEDSDDGDQSSEEEARHSRQVNRSQGWSDALEMETGQNWKTSRILGRITNSFIETRSVIDIKIDHLAGNDLTEEEERWLPIYDSLVARIPAIGKLVAVGDQDGLDEILAMVQEAMDQGKHSDTANLRRAIEDYVPQDRKRSVNPKFHRQLKSDRGYAHPATFFWAAVAAGEIEFTADEYSALMYHQDKADPDNVEAGLLEGHLPIHVRVLLCHFWAELVLDVLSAWYDHRQDLRGRPEDENTWEILAHCNRKIFGNDSGSRSTTRNSVTRIGGGQGTGTAWGSPRV
ncbi:hypothetical protein C8F01DRAFT_1084128 [Mycena amicta]|nr:hypothetical protein C8F01DRAFT_1084128 [Mycena amicta]